MDQRVTYEPTEHRASMIAATRIQSPTMLPEALPERGAAFCRQRVSSDSHAELLCASSIRNFDPGYSGI